MDDLMVEKSPLPWWLAGLVLGLVQILAVWVNGPLGVSTQFVVADSKVIHQVSPEYAQDHALIGKEKYQTIGYGWWFDVGLVIGAVIAALAVKGWKVRGSTVWWRVNYGPGIAGRMVAGFVGGVLILLGARLAHGCTSGQFASGWAQLSVSALPFTVTLFGFGMLTALVVYRKSAQIK